MTINQSIILGVVSGVLASFIVWIMIILFQKVVLPWYQKIVYQGLKISGTWIGLYKNKAKLSTKDDPDYNIYLKQKGHIISGIMIRNKNINDIRDTKEFIINGVFRDGNLVFSYKPEDETRLGLGSYVMKLTDDGKCFDGISLYIASNGLGQVAQFSTIWYRVS